MTLAQEWRHRLRPQAHNYAAQALDNIGREFPSYLTVLLTGPGEFPARPRDRTPVFFGSFDWHSCVEMHWVLVRLLKVAADAVPAEEIRAALDRQLTGNGLRTEAEFMRAKGGFERPYGWGWALALAHELATWPGDQDAPRWAAAMEPLAAALTGNFLGWLPKATYPVRTGLHANSSFGLSLALPYAQALAGAGQPSLRAAIEDAAHRWYRADTDYPAAWEPSGHDFLSPALAEAELMARLLPAGDFAPVAGGVPARPGRRPARVPVHPGGRLRFQRRADRPPARPQPQPRLVLPPPGRDPAARRPARPGLHRGFTPARRSVPAARDRRRLHGHPLARRLRRPALQLRKLSPAAAARPGPAARRTPRCQRHPPRR